MDGTKSEDIENIKTLASLSAPTVIERTPPQKCPGQGTKQSKIASSLRARHDHPIMRSEIRSIPGLLTVEEVCQMLKISKGGLYQMVQRRELPGTVKIGRRLRFRAEAIEKWLTDCELKSFNDMR